MIAKSLTNVWLCLLGTIQLFFNPPLVRRLYTKDSTSREHLKASFQGCVQLPNGNGTAKQGVSEKQFFRYLLCTFLENLICQLVEFEIPEYVCLKWYDVLKYGKH